MQDKVLDRGERKEARRGILLSAPLGLKDLRGKYKVQAGGGTMYMRICSGETTSWSGRGRGTGAGDAQRRRGRCYGRS